ncbi:unnamed protein product [Durusdinium trenchii]|uniref:Sugar phosphate transporter domain-containing protein n=1 Tax=Durusdinium trenchii TaxID=1381693 RepID=A0ABP0SYT4_9DINO
MNSHVASILQELVFFLSLVCISETLRRLLRRAKPQSRAVEGLLICSLVLGVSITLVLLNKWVMTSWKGGLPFPLLYTMSHMVLKGCFALSYLKVTCQPLGLPSRGACCGATLVGVMTALDVAASNMSFLFITVAFYTMLKSASLIFILAAHSAFRTSHRSFGIAGTVLLIALGIFMTSYGETEFDVQGSELFAAMRWLATQKTLHASGLSAMQTVLFMSPASSLTLAPIVWWRERHKLKLLAEVTSNIAMWSALALAAWAFLPPVLGNYPAITPEEVWCTVPNYRYYRWTVIKARGYPISESLDCSYSPKPDGCSCSVSSECLSGYCIGGTNCSYPIYQVAELEFYRGGSKVNTQKVNDTEFDAYRVVNMNEIPQTWGIWELEFYSDTSCSTLINGNGTVISSSAMAAGFGHSIDHTAPLGLHDTPRTYWQSRPFDPPMTFDLHGPAMYAFDGNLTTNWWADCRPCAAQSQWLGLSFAEAQKVKCIRVVQDKDHDYASFSLGLEARNISTGSWVHVTTFNAATWAYGGVWEQLVVPQGVAFLSDLSHARALDGDLSSTVVDLVGVAMEFDFGVETELDAFRFATALEPSDDRQVTHDGVACHLDGRCFRDPVQWTLEGSLDRSTWVVVQAQNASDYLTPIYRRTWVGLQRLTHLVSLDITDIWPDGRGTCAVRR